MESLTDNLKWRELLQDCSDIEKVVSLRESSFYCGFDPTAPSLQLGNLVPIMAMIHIGRMGRIKPIAVLGGATGAIGDPSGKTSDRKLLNNEEVEENISRQKLQLTHLFQNSRLQVEILNNRDWTKDLNFLDFLRDTGKHFTVGYMLQKESVKERLHGEGISFTEFSYMLLQAYDFLHLYQNFNCKMQVGGSDQWGNITAGMELIRKKIKGEAYGLTFPLITDSSGKKFGKSEGGAIWIDPKMTSPFKFHQYFLNIDDRDVIRFLKIFTFLTRQEIQNLSDATISSPHERKAQHALADAVCSFVHGESATKKARSSAKVLFGGSPEGLSPDELLDIFQDVPSSSISHGELVKLSFVDLLIRAGLVKSKGEARRLIQNGGAYIMNERVSDLELTLQLSPYATNPVIILRIGKKNYHLVQQTFK